jgi:tRNA threonylcarbamoyladenosine biosynthesis protein TsaB
MLLALDTSTAYASVALADGETILADLTWRVENRQSAELLPRIDEMMRALRISPDQVDAIAVALGPGSFNGVRAGVATAKGLALARGAALVGVPTLDVIAWGARLAPGEVWALLDAGRGEMYAAVYDPATSPESWAPRGLSTEPNGEAAPYHIVTPLTLAAIVRDDATLVGELRAGLVAPLTTALAGRTLLATELRRGAWLAALGAAWLRAGRGATVETLEPLYLRRPTITRSSRPDIVGLSVSIAEDGARAEDRGKRLAL